MCNILASDFNSTQFKMNSSVPSVSQAGFRNMLVSMLEPAPALAERAMRTTDPVCMSSTLKMKHTVREFPLSLEGEWEGQESSQRKQRLRSEK